jgi:hypothetical protein
MPETRAVGASQAALVASVKHMHIAEFGCQAVGEGACAVWAVVVRDQNVHEWGTCTYLADEGVEVFDFVKSGKYENGPIAPSNCSVVHNLNTS